MKHLPRLPFDVQHLVVRKFAGDLSSFDRKRTSSLASLALVSKAFQEIVYPLLYSSISLRPLSTVEQDLITKAPSSARPAHPDQEDLFDFLRSSPSLAAQVVSLQVLTWNPIDFALFPNLRHFDCAWEVRSKLLVPLEVKPKLLSMSVRVGLEQTHDEHWNQIIEEDNDLEGFDFCVDTSELKSLTLSYQPSGQHHPTLYLFPSLKLSSLTSFTLEHNLYDLDGLVFPPRNLKALLQLVGPRLSHLALHEKEISRGSHEDYEPWVLPLCPNLLTFKTSGLFFPRDLVENGHASLREIVVGVEAEAKNLEQELEREREADAYLRLFLEGAVKLSFPSMSILRLDCLSFKPEDRDEDVATLIEKLQAQLGWVVKDEFGTSWRKEWSLKAVLQEEEDEDAYTFYPNNGEDFDGGGWSEEDDYEEEQRHWAEHEDEGDGRVDNGYGYGYGHDSSWRL